MSVSSTTGRDSALNWADLLNESVHTSDDQDIGDVEAVNRDFVVVKRGFVNIHRYFIPADKIEGWDGNVLWLKITEEEVKRKYQNDDAKIEPSRYLTKDYANYYRYGVYPAIGWIPIRYAEPTYPVPTTMNEPVAYKCDLCGITFKDDSELKQHIKTTH